ncbi:MAG: RNase adapter RapZ [Bacillota bacterium]|nr:RNase adapter RapZ [Bacillota bacterium]HOP70036.1 RNase adapter RapZ [Bacillota bacterium]HPT35380.1 RNase adapter RapZ [Bacillota bacterium]HPZ84794.1 RNase adapter RapZ [Bacillota bacterium]HQD85350.1 RNase adapter RapZ [Bacillota bacterium]
MKPNASIAIITGLSGAGKSHALKTLEDLGYFCVDNLPPSLIPKFLELCSQGVEPKEKIALVVDIRGGEFFQDLTDALAEIKAQGINPLILFLEADDNTLIKRYKLTRRRHPLSYQGGILEAIKEERNRLQSIREQATTIVDTSQLSPADLRKELYEIIARHTNIKKLVITLVSFGFKHGLPKDADLVFDVRFLPNPHYVPDLRPLTGLEPEVSRFVLDSALTKRFLRHLTAFLDFLLPNFIEEGKTHLTVAIGCTGGQHRSVAIAENLKSYFESKEHMVVVEHRDINIGESGGPAQ